VVRVTRRGRVGDLRHAHTSVGAGRRHRAVWHQVKGHVRFSGAGWHAGICSQRLGAHRAQVGVEQLDLEEDAVIGAPLVAPQR